MTEVGHTNDWAFLKLLLLFLSVPSPMSDLGQEENLTQFFLVLLTIVIWLHVCPPQPGFKTRQLDKKELFPPSCEGRLRLHVGYSQGYVRRTNISYILPLLTLVTSTMLNRGLVDHVTIPGQLGDNSSSSDSLLCKICLLVGVQLLGLPLPL